VRRNLLPRCSRKIGNGVVRVTLFNAIKRR
jgi:hypothetical protein